MKKTLVRYSLFIFLLFLGSSARVFAQQGFGTKEPSKASVVDMHSYNKGLLIPRVELDSLTNFYPITGEIFNELSKTNSLLVYNTADIDQEIYPGFYYWTTDGTTGKWNRLLTVQDISADNGLTPNGNIIELGGPLTKNTEIDLNGNTLALEGLPSGLGSDNVLVADPLSGVIKQINQAPRFFYMPSVIFDTSELGTGLTRDLYQDYVNQFTGGVTGAGSANYPISAGGPNITPLQYTGGLVGSAGAPDDIPILQRSQLYYYVTYFDTAVFANLSIDSNGVLTYDIIGNATDTSYMNIVFVLK